LGSESFASLGHTRGRHECESFCRLPSVESCATRPESQIPADLTVLTADGENEKKMERVSPFKESKRILVLIELKKYLSGCWEI
jgi:hypothetical protein